MVLFLCIIAKRTALRCSACIHSIVNSMPKMASRVRKGWCYGLQKLSFGFEMHRSDLISWYSDHVLDIYLQLTAISMICSIVF